MRDIRKIILFVNRFPVLYYLCVLPGCWHLHRHLIRHFTISVSSMVWETAVRLLPELGWILVVLSWYWLVVKFPLLLEASWQHVQGGLWAFAASDTDLVTGWSTRGFLYILLDDRLCCQRRPWRHCCDLLLLCDNHLLVIAPILNFEFRLNIHRADGSPVFLSGNLHFVPQIFLIRSFSLVWISTAVLQQVISSDSLRPSFIILEFSALIQIWKQNRISTSIVGFVVAGRGRGSIFYSLIQIHMKNFWWIPIAILNAFYFI